MSEPGSTPKSPLGFDEIIAIFVAFATLGTIFILSFPSTERGFNIFETGTSSPTGETSDPTRQPTQNRLNPPATPGRVPAVSPQFTNPTTQDNSTSRLEDSNAWGAFALPLFSPTANPNATAVPTGEATEEATSTVDETETLSSPPDGEAAPIESVETPDSDSSPLATPATEATTDSTPNP